MFKITKVNICIIGMLVGIGLISLLPVMGLTCRWGCTLGSQDAEVLQYSSSYLCLFGAYLLPVSVCKALCTVTYRKYFTPPNTYIIIIFHHPFTYISYYNPQYMFPFDGFRSLELRVNHRIASVTKDRSPFIVFLI